MRILKKNFLSFFKLTTPFIVIIGVVFLFYWKVFVKNYVPLPGDFIVGVYHPWIDYKWPGFPNGVPVKNPITTDVVSYTYPMQTFAMSLLKEGKLPLWNPYILAGSPLLANFQSAPFAPTSFVYFLFDKITAWSVQVILQHLLAILFTYFLLRRWKVSKLGSILGGVIFSFSGYNIIFSQWNGHTLAASFIPLVLLFEDRLLEKRKFIDGFGLSISLALQFFSGYTQTSVYMVVAIGILWLVKIFKDKQYLSKTFVLSIFCLLSIGLAAIQILPSLELINNSQRDFEPHPYEWTFLPWKKVITFISADYYGNHGTQNYWGPQDYTSNTGFVGVTSVVLAIIASWQFKKRKEIFFLLILAITSLLLSFPTPISIFVWNKNILGMQANSAHRGTVLFTAAIAFLAGFGFDLIAGKLHKRTLFLSLLVPFLLLLSFTIYAYIIRFKTIFGVSILPIALRNLILPSLVLVAVSIILFIIPRLKLLLIILVVIELFYFGFKYTPFSPREFVYPVTPILSFLESQERPFRTTGAKVIPSNLRMAYALEAPEGYDTFHPLKVSQFIAGINSGTVSTLPVGRYGIVDNDKSLLLDLVNTKYYLSLKNKAEEFDPKRFKLAFSDGEVVVLESKSVLPRAFMVYDWEVEPKSLNALDKLLNPKYPLGKKIILSQELNLQKQTKPVSNEVKYVVYDTQKSIINIRTEKDGLLFISDAYYPGWYAYLDGVETKILLADFAFRSVVIPKGNHELKMVYAPDTFYKGVKITVISFIILLGLGVVYKLYLRKFI